MKKQAKKELIKKLTKYIEEGKIKMPELRDLRIELALWLGQNGFQYRMLK